MLMPSRFMAEITPVLSPKSRIPRRQHLRLHPQPAALFLRPRLHLSRAHRKFLLTRSSGERVGSLATCREGIAGVQNLDFTVITNTRSISGRISSSTAAAVAGLIATPARFPSSLILRTVRWILLFPSQCTTKEIGTSRSKCFQGLVRIPYHQVRFQRKSGDVPERLHDRNSHR